MSKSPPAAASSLVSAEDRLLIEACLARQGSGWEAFLDRFGWLFAHVVTATARQRGIPLASADREDLVAETILACLQNQASVLRAFAGRSSLATYLTVVARRVAVKRLKPEIRLQGDENEQRAAVSSIRREIHVLSTFHHPHIIRLLGYTSTSAGVAQDLCLVYELGYASLDKMLTDD